MKNKSIPFSEFRRFLETVGFQEKKVPKALVFRHPREGLLVFRVYRDDENVDLCDLASTRMFLDYRGVLSEADFDHFVQEAPTSA